MQVHKIFIKLKPKGGVPLLKEVVMAIIAIVFVILLQYWLVYLLYAGEEEKIKKELKESTLWNMGDWSEKKSMKPDSIVRSISNDAQTGELLIGIGEKKYRVKVDSSEKAFEREAIVAYDLNLRNPITLACLDSLVKHRAEEVIGNLSIAFRRVDSLGNTKEVYPPGNTRYMDMEEAGYVRLGYISGEKVGVLFDFTWKDFLYRFWWQFTGIILVGSVLVVLIVSFACRIWKQRKLRQLQEACLRQRMHDLKRPVGAVEGLFLRLQRQIQKVSDREKGEEMCDIGLEKAAMLKREMSNVLQLAMLMYRKRVEWVDISLKEELVTLAAEEQFANPEKDIRVELDYRLPNVLLLSEQFLYALRNLMDNAVKYSGETVFIKVACYREGKALVVSVTDEGKGIAKKDLPYIFEEYWRVGRDEKAKGFGLGLASVQKIVKRHKGKIHVESELGKGSTFTIKLDNYGKKDKTFVCRGRGADADHVHGNIIGARI